MHTNYSCRYEKICMLNTSDRYINHRRYRHKNIKISQTNSEREVEVERMREREKGERDGKLF